MPGIVTKIKFVIAMQMQRVIRMGSLKMHGVMDPEVEEIKLR